MTQLSEGIMTDMILGGEKEGGGEGGGRGREREGRRMEGERKWRDR